MDHLLHKLLSSSMIEPIWLPWVGLLIALGIIVFVSFVAQIIAHFYFSHLIRGVVKRLQPRLAEAMARRKLSQRVSRLIPAIVAYQLTPLLHVAATNITFYLVAGISTVLLIYIWIALFIAIDGGLKVIEDFYGQFEVAKRRPIKSYIQLVRFLGFGFTVLMLATVIFNKSALTFVTGLGAATAVLLLVFKDALLGLVASIQLAVFDIVRIGDWIEMPSFGADGEVFEISLSTLKVRNFDKTITTIPTSALLSTGIKNWRGMREAGGRRIKRSIAIDTAGIRFCDRAMLERFKDLEYLQTYFSAEAESAASKPIRGPWPAPDQSAATNLGIFRAYLMEYLRKHPAIHCKDGFALLVRQQQAADKGLPLEVYAFVNTIESAAYDKAQDEIFEHIIAALPFFGLRVYQSA